MMALLQLQGQVDDSPRIITELKSENQQLRDNLTSLRSEIGQVESGVVELRNVLTPLYRALQKIFGDMDEMGVGGGSDPVVSGKNSAAWEPWKQRLGGATARAIDALMVHGEMNQTQLRIILGCATRTVTNVVAALNQAKLIDKNGGKIRLKEL